MKIRSLRFTNLNSLQGENVIDFTQPPLSGSGIFAITGQTGAGKTTILDAITLALYGRVARYGNEHPESVMSRHTGECSAEVEFSCKAGIFRSTWLLQKARKKPEGNLQPQKRTIAELPNGTIIAAGIKQSDDKIEALTGLDYERFLRSVLLAQGEFATFLKSDAKERSSLLQEVTGTAIYNRISQEAFGRASETNRQYEQLLEEQKKLEILDETSRAALKVEQQGFEEKVATVTGTLELVSTRLQAARQWLELQRTAAQLEIDRAIHLQQRTEAASDLDRLHRHEKAFPSAVGLATLDRLTAEQQTEQHRATELESLLPLLSTQLAEAETAHKTTQLALETLENSQETNRALWAEIAALDETLAAARESQRQMEVQAAQLAQETALQRKELGIQKTALVEIETNFVLQESWLEKHKQDAVLSSALPGLHAALERWEQTDKLRLGKQKTLEKEQAELNAQTAKAEKSEAQLPPLTLALEKIESEVQQAEISLAKISGGATSLELEQRRDATREKRNVLEKLGNEARALQQLEERIAANSREVERVHREIQEGVQQLATRKTQREQAAKLVEAHRHTLSLLDRIQTLEEHRSNLRPGEACPLCGALEHPFASPDWHPAESMTTARRTLAVSEQELRAAQEAVSEAEKHQAKLLTSQTNLEGERSRLVTERSALLSHWSESAPEEFKDHFCQLEHLEKLLAETLEAENQANKRHARVRAAEQSLQELRSARQKAQAELDQVRGVVERQRALAAQIAQRLPVLEEEKTAATHSVEDARHRFGELVRTLAIPPSERTQAKRLLESFAQRANEFAEQEKKMNLLRTEHSSGKTRVHGVSTQLEIMLKKAEELKPKCDQTRQRVLELEKLRCEKFGDRTVAAVQAEVASELRALREKAETARVFKDRIRADHAARADEQKKLAESLAQRAGELKTLGERLGQTALAAGFVSTETMRLALLPQPEADLIRGKQRKLEERRTQLETQTATLQQRRAELPFSSEEDAANLENLETQRSLCATEQALLNQEIGRVRATLEADDKQRAKGAEFAEKLQVSLLESQRWEKLRKLIGSADGSLFARFAQGLALERLTALANRHLECLNPRYSIRGGEKLEDLELQIVDHYQANVVRPMTSLSGGESFLASLSLALGLSELASGRVTIESLFIDEGFGSLDLDTLETALSAMETLQAEGKTIGIISHIPSIQERIPVQIRVQKGSGGRSSLSLLVS